MRKKIASIFLAAILVTSCSWSDIIGMVSPAKQGGIDTEVVVGDKQEKIEAALQSNVQTQEAESITNVVDTNPVLLVLAMLGWFAPSPQELHRMWRSRNVKP